ncbi:MAG: acyl-CoA thioesterase [Dehalococcoidia bacterium]|nr:acyl-CoA thioesterase [Dehalococcoidia bacterium]
MPRVTEYRMRVRSTDMDSDRIVNNAHYFEYFQEARLDHLAAIRVTGQPRKPGDGGRTFTLAETTCTYRSPLRHRDDIVVRAWTKEVRNRSFVLGYEIVRQDSGALVAEGSSAQVWLDAEGAPTPLPDAVRQALQDSL